MNISAMFMASVTALSAVGYLTWAWFAMARVEQELRSFSGFEAADFEIGPQTAANSKGARWLIPG